MKRWNFLLQVLAVLAVLIGCAPAVWAQHTAYDLSTTYNADEPWRAAYFWQHARIQLGPEQRLPNGVSWRLLTDAGTGLAMPRLTWMPNKRRLAAANRLLDMVQGGDMLIEKDQWRIVELENDFRKRLGALPLDLRRTLEQKDVGLTYAGTRFMSIMESLIVYPSGSLAQVIARGLTFDLDNNTVAHVTECTGAKKPYGEGDPDSFLFRYGEWLQFCDQMTYRKFIALLEETADRLQRRLQPPKESEVSARCSIQFDRPLIQEERRYFMYLTFEGLAVQLLANECPTRRTADNPIIVPYPSLEPFMGPGPLRDELIALR